MQITDFVARHNDANHSKLALLGTVKETGVDDQGLLDFYQTYFDRHPMYMDEHWKLYEAMGGRKLSLWGLFKAMLVAKPRWYRKGIPSSENNYRSDPWMTGGVLVFNKDGQLVYAMEETVGDEFNMERLERAIQAARNMYDTDGNEAVDSAASQSSTTATDTNSAT